MTELAASLPVVAVTGPRQSGKMTLCRYAFPEKPYVSLEPLDTRAYAAEDPRGFLKEYSAGAIFGEASQRRGAATVIPWRELHEHTW